MLRRQIMKAAVWKALNNGYKPSLAECRACLSLREIVASDFWEEVDDGRYMVVLFSHDFAKAFFGQDWRAHLRQLVLEENHFAYLEEFLDKSNGGGLSQGS
jgi:hypothetical protein